MHTKFRQEPFTKPQRLLGHDRHDYRPAMHITYNTLLGNVQAEYTQNTTVQMKDSSDRRAAQLIAHNKQNR